MLGPGEQRRPAAEHYPFDAFPAAAALVAYRRPYLFGSGVPADFASAPLEARLEKTSQAGVPLLVGGRVWGELWVASTRTGLPLEPGDLPLICWAGTRFGAMVNEMLGDGMVLDVTTARPATASRPYKLESNVWGAPVVTAGVVSTVAQPGGAGGARRTPRQA